MVIGFLLGCVITLSLGFFIYRMVTAYDGEMEERMKAEAKDRGSLPIRY